MKILFLGPVSSFMVHNLITGFKNMGHDLVVLNTSDSVTTTHLPLDPSISVINLYDHVALIPPSKKKGVKSRIKDVIRKNKGFYRFLQRIFTKANLRAKIAPIPSAARIKIQTALKDETIELIYSFWGGTVFPELNFIKSISTIPVLHDFQSFPLDLSKVGEDALVNPEIESLINKLEGRIMASENMERYFATAMNLDYGINFIQFNYFRKMYFRTKNLPLLSAKDSQPHLVFIGRTDFKDRSHDNVLRLVKEIAKKKIHVHMSIPNIDPPESQFIHYFENFSKEQLASGEFANFLTRFDGCILLYNINERYYRYHNSHSARFLFALPAGIPVVIPDGLFDASQKFAERHGIGFAYKGIDELYEKLTDKSYMESIRKRCAESIESGEFYFENHEDAYNDMFNQVVEKYGKEN